VAWLPGACKTPFLRLIKCVVPELGRGSPAPKAKVTRSNRVGCATSYFKARCARPNRNSSSVSCERVSNLDKFIASARWLSTDDVGQTLVLLPRFRETRESVWLALLLLNLALLPRPGVTVFRLFNISPSVSADRVAPASGIVSFRYKGALQRLLSPFGVLQTAPWWLHRCHSHRVWKEAGRTSYAP
jgi:hypothetical protein